MAAAVGTDQFVWTTIGFAATGTSLLAAGAVLCFGLLWGKGAGFLAATMSFPILWLSFAVIIFLVLALADTAASVGLS